MQIPKSHFIVALALALVTASAHAQSDTIARTVQSLQQAALSDPTAYGIVRDLTTKFGARPAGSDAEVRSAEWCAAQMRAMGLTNVRIETFPLTGWSRGEERVEILGENRQALAATALGGVGPTAPEGVSGEVVLFATFDDLLAQPAGSLAGKIAMVNYQMPRLESGNGYGVASRARGQGPIEAAKRGAVGYLLRSAGTGPDRFPHTGATRYQNGKVPIPGFALAASDADQLARLAAAGPVRVRLFTSSTPVPNRTSQNVIGEIRGREVPDEIILMGAHLDSWDLGTGAVDDGAGVGIVMGAARLINLLPQKPRRTIRVVLYGAEEVSQPSDPVSLAGGNAYAVRYADQLPKHVIASEADLGADAVHSLMLPEGWAARELGTTAAKLLLPLDILVDSVPAPHGGADITPLKNAGVPVFLLRQNAANYFDLHHTANDTFDKIDRKQFDQVVAGWVSFVWLVSESGVDFRSAGASSQ